MELAARATRAVHLGSAPASATCGRRGGMACWEGLGEARASARLAAARRGEGAKRSPPPMRGCGRVRCRGGVKASSGTGEFA